MCRLAVLFRRPLHEIATWPAAELQLLRAYLSRRPMVEERIELTIAAGQAAWANARLKDGVAPKSAADFLFFRDDWPEPEPTDFTRHNRAAIRAFRALSARIRS